MSAPRFRAFHFVIPEPGSDGRGTGLHLEGGRIAMVDEEASVRQAILLLLATRPGERVMRPAYGCDLARLVFSPNDDTTAGLAVHYVRRALEVWEPRIDVLSLDARRAAEEGQLEIYLAYRVRASQHRDQLSVRFALDGGIS
jgi:uncharacterized protein